MITLSAYLTLFGVDSVEYSFKFRDLLGIDPGSLLDEPFAGTSLMAPRG